MSLQCFTEKQRFGGRFQFLDRASVGKFFVDMDGHTGIAFGDSSGVVGDEAEQDAVVADVDVGVVAGGFGKWCDLIDEGDGFDEVAECPFTGELAVGELPVRELFEELFDLRSGEGLLHGLYLASRCY